MGFRSLLNLLQQDANLYAEHQREEKQEEEERQSYREALDGADTHPCG